MGHRQIDLFPKSKRRGLHGFFQSDTPTALTKTVEVVEIPSRFVCASAVVVDNFFLAID
jgi:hypothetical protein